MGLYSDAFVNLLLERRVKKTQLVLQYQYCDKSVFKPFQIFSIDI